MYYVYYNVGTYVTLDAISTRSWFASKLRIIRNRIYIVLL